MGFKDFVSRLKEVPALLSRPGVQREIPEADLVRMEAEARRLFKDAIMRIGHKQWQAAAGDIEKARQICTVMGWQDGIAHADYLLDQALSKKANDARAREARAAITRPAGGKPARAATNGVAGDHVEKLRKIIKVSDRIEVARLAEVLGIEEKLAWTRVFDWAEEFGFKVDGNMIVFGSGDMNRLVTGLDKEFAKWHGDKL
ncbi:MAG: hypothetical protein GYA24_13290 [Candidatus Lokiarchaeota archaeon]|nr:hypothetical protein [Candidatus Lokiarchaeota archaeon]